MRRRHRMEAPANRSHVRRRLLTCFASWPRYYRIGCHDDQDRIGTSSRELLHLFCPRPNDEFTTDASKILGHAVRTFIRANQDSNPVIASFPTTGFAVAVNSRRAQINNAAAARQCFGPLMHFLHADCSRPSLTTATVRKKLFCDCFVSLDRSIC